MKKKLNLLFNTHLVRILCFMIGCYTIVEYITFGDANYTVRNYLFYFILIYTLFSVTYNIIINNIKFSKLYIITAGMWLVFTVGTIINNSYSTLNSYVNLLEMLVLMTLVFVNSKGISRKKIAQENKIILNIFVAFILIINLLSILVYLSNQTVIIGDYTIMKFIDARFTGFYTNPNLTGAYNMIAIIISFKLFQKGNILKKICLIANVFVSLAMLILSDSRSMILALFLISILYFIYFLIKAKLVMKIVVALIFVFSCFFVNASLSNIEGLGRDMDYSSYFKQFIQSTEITEKEKILDKITSSRYTLWKETAVMIEEGQLFGYGVGNFQKVALEKIGESSAFISNDLTNSHLLFLNVLFCGGIIGFIIFMLFIILSLNQIRLYYKYDLDDSFQKFSEIMLLLAIFIYSMLDIGILFDYRLISFFFWLQLGYICHKNYLRTEKQNEKNKLEAHQ